MQQEAVDDYHRRTKTLKAVQSRTEGSFNFKTLFNLNFIVAQITLKFLYSDFKYQHFVVVFSQFRVTTDSAP